MAIFRVRRDQVDQLEQALAPFRGGADGEQGLEEEIVVIVAEVPALAEGRGRGTPRTINCPNCGTQIRIA